jgi:hypothetical protein
MIIIIIFGGEEEEVGISALFSFAVWNMLAAFESFRDGPVYDYDSL